MSDSSEKNGPRSYVLRDVWYESLSEVISKEIMPEENKREMLFLTLSNAILDLVMDIIPDEYAKVVADNIDDFLAVTVVNKENNIDLLAKFKEDFVKEKGDTFDDEEQLQAALEAFEDQWWNAKRKDLKGKDPERGPGRGGKALRHRLSGRSLPQIPSHFLSGPPRTMLITGLTIAEAAMSKGKRFNVVASAPGKGHPPGRARRGLRPTGDSGGHRPEAAVLHHPLGHVHAERSSAEREDARLRERRGHQVLVWGASGHMAPSSEFPSGSGLGSSAAVSVATLGAIESLQGGLDARKVARDAFEIESLVQGRASPIDTSTSAHGSGIFVNKVKGDDFMLGVGQGRPALEYPSLRCTPAQPGGRVSLASPRPPGPWWPR